MANARKCDRCGKCFDPFSQKFRQMTHFKNPVFETERDIIDHKVGCYLVEDSPDALIDLCPDCTESFILFMKNYPLAVDKGYFDKADMDGDEEIKLPSWDECLKRNKASKSTDEESKEYQKTAFQKFLDEVDALGDKFFNDLEN